MKYVSIIEKILDEKIGFSYTSSARVIEFFDYINQTGDFTNYDFVFEKIYSLCTVNSRLLVWAPFWVLESSDHVFSFEYFLGVGDIKLKKKEQDVVNYFVKKWIIRWKYSSHSKLNESNFYPIKKVNCIDLREYCKLVWSSLVWLYCIIVVSKDIVVYVHEDMWFVVVDLWDNNWLTELIVWSVDPSQGIVYNLNSQ